MIIIQLLSIFLNAILLITTAPCRTVTYEARELKFNQDPISVWFGEDNSEDEIHMIPTPKKTKNLEFLITLLIPDMFTCILLLLMKLLIRLS